MATSRAAALLLVALVASVLAQGTAAAVHASRTTRTRTAPPAVRVRCTGVQGVEAGESCRSVARSAGIPDAQFLALNPNITCAAIFPGQWVCVAGAVVG